MNKKAPSTITFLTFLSGNINIAKLYEALPVVKIIEEESGKEIFFLCEETKSNGDVVRPRIKIPFYGNLGGGSFIVSVRYENKSRGVRRGGKSFNNVTSVDLQCCDKNIHIKISKTKLTLTGVLSVEMGQKASWEMCHLINMTTDNIEYLTKFPQEKMREILNWLYLNCQKDESFLTPDEIMISAPTHFDTRILETLLLYITDNTTVTLEDYKDKIDFLLDLEEISTRDIEPCSYQICTKAFNEVLDIGELNMTKLSMFLVSKGFQVDFDNKRPSELVMRIPSESQVGKFHHFVINRKKTIKHNSPAEQEETEFVSDEVKRHIQMFLESSHTFEAYLEMLSI